MSSSRGFLLLGALSFLGLTMVILTPLLLSGVFLNRHIDTLMLDYKVSLATQSGLLVGPQILNQVPFISEMASLDPLFDSLQTGFCLPDLDVAVCLFQDSNMLYALGTFKGHRLVLRQIKK